MLLHNRSYGREQIAYILFIVILIVSTLFVLKINLMKQNIDVSFKESMKKSIYKTTKTGQTKVTKSIINVDNNIFLTVVVSNDEFVVVKMPRPGFYFQIVDIPPKDSLYQYFMSLSNVIKVLSENKNVESDSLKVLSAVISDYAAIFYSLSEYDNSRTFNLFASNEELNKQLYDYLYSLHITLNQLQRTNYEMITYDNKYTGINQKSYASNLLKVRDDIELEQYLSEDVKFLVKNIIDQVIGVANSYIMTVPQEKYLRSKGILIFLIEKSSLEDNTKFALLNPLKANLPISSEVIVFVNTMLTLLKSDPMILGMLNNQQKQLLLDTVSSIKFKNVQPIDSLIDYNLAAKFNCQKKHGTFKDGLCVLSN